MVNIFPEEPNAATTLPANAGAVSDAAERSFAEGLTTIKDSVIAKVAGLAVQEIPGVHALGSTPVRAIGAVVGSISNTELNPGVTVEIGDDGVTVQITLVAGYPVPLTTLADQVRTSVARAIEGLVGMSVRAVDVTITDIYVAEESDDNDVA
jgi:uncharacterized alkaline shock family protein YloU